MERKYNFCLQCGKTVSKKCQKGYCSECRDRTGKNNPFYGKSHTKDVIEKIKSKNKIKSKKLWENPVYREKVIKGISKPRKESFKKEQSQRIIEWYKSNPDQKEIRSEYMKKYWLEGIIEPNIHSINESKIEKEIRKFFEENFPLKNVRKKTIRINNKWFYPDIIIDDKIIIEFYGDYWHANPKKYKPNEYVHHNFSAKEIWENDKKREDVLTKNGYNLFIIWEKDYNENPNIIKNIVEAINCDGK